jgi:PAS domain S-box-containing protein
MPESAGPQVMVINSRDVTESYEIAASLAQSEERLRSLVEHNADAIAVLDANGHYQSANPALEELLGFSTEELTGRGLGFLMSPEERERARAIFARVLSGQPQRLEQVLQHRNGRRIEVATTVVPIVVRGQVAGAYAILRDVTEHNRQDALLLQARAEAERARAEAEAANLAKSEFLGRMSHELRTPLNAILGFGQLLEMGRLGERERKSVAQITKAGRHLLDLINEVLDIARIESGHLDLHPERVSARSRRTEWSRCAKSFRLASPDRMPGPTATKRATRGCMPIRSGCARSCSTSCRTR